MFYRNVHRRCRRKDGHGFHMFMSFIPPTLVSTRARLSTVMRTSLKIKSMLKKTRDPKVDPSGKSNAVSKHSHLILLQIGKISEKELQEIALVQDRKFKHYTCMTSSNISQPERSN